ncbi:MAG: trypsin-like peptidase domain-containing protein [Bacteroidetes bacterium]|nr:trypsin-like peptidase domain-containing protein [Bacteroidota bacterium]
MKKFLSAFFFFLYLSFAAFSQSSLDATYIADKYFNGIVKILLFDSLAEKKQPNSGYIGRGSGFVVTDDGLIFTNRHVVEYCVYGYMDYLYIDPATYEEIHSVSIYSEDKINEPTTKKVYRTGYTTPIVQIYFGKGEDDYKLYYAKVIAMDVGSFDGAILKIISELNGNPVTEKFHPIPIGNSDSTKQGEDLCIYGFPAQFDAGFNLMLKDMSTLTFGKHSGFDFVFNKEYGYIKTDASINSGNSGGPVFNRFNKVIGIATATGNKTNIGLIGGINGMHAIAKSDETLLRALEKAGLNSASAKAEVGSAIITGAQRPLIAQKKMKRIISGKKQERKFQNGTFYMKPLATSFFIDDKFTLDSAGKLPVANPNEPVRLVSSAASGFELGYQFPLWRISSHAKLSLDYAFLGAYFYATDWTRVQLNDSIPKEKISSPAHRIIGNFYTKLGPAFSVLLFKRIIFEAHLQAAPTIISPFNHVIISYQAGSTENDWNLSNAFGFSMNSGGSMRYRFLSVGVEYFFIRMPNLEIQNLRNGTFVSASAGKMTLSTLMLSLGFNFSKE